MSERRKKVLVVGAGLAGATAARCLTNHFDVVVMEERNVIGGQIRVEKMNGVPYELYGPHIFHTEDPEIEDFVSRYTQIQPYRHTVKTYAPNGQLVSWPPQVSELSRFPEWDFIDHELKQRPDKSHRRRGNFEEYAIDVMGETLYRWFCRDYTRKQWGQDPRSLSAQFAPKRIDLRTDDNRELFKDRFQGWMDGTNLVEGLLHGIPVVTGKQVTVSSPEIVRSDIQVITAPLDVFLERSMRLKWRGQSFRHEFIPHVDTPRLTAPVVNEPRLELDHIRRYETKQMAGSRVRGTVISTETPGSDARHYPVLDVNGENRELHRRLVTYMERNLPDAYLCGRLANYVYIDMDQAIRQGMNAARQIKERYL